jgi:transcriptional regulator with XRE-family HTH domain
MIASVKPPSKMPMTERLAALRLQIVATEMSARIGERIRERREELGMRTQRELADLIPSDTVTNQTVSNWERGVNQPSPRYLRELAEALQVDVSYFLQLRDKPAKGKTPDPFDGSIQEQLAEMGKAIEKQAEALVTQAGVLEELRDAVQDLRELIATQQAAARHLEEWTEAATKALPDGSVRQQEQTGTSRET